MPRPRRQASKAGRNERRKLLANTLNGLGVAALLAGYLQPALAALRSGHLFSRGEALAALVFGAAGLTLHLGAQAVATRLED